MDPGESFTVSVTGATTTGTELTGNFSLSSGGTDTQTISQASGTISATFTAPNADFTVSVFITDDCGDSLQSTTLTCNVPVCIAPTATGIDCTFTNGEICWTIENAVENDFTAGSFTITEVGQAFPVESASGITDFASLVSRCVPVANGTYDIEVLLDHNCGGDPLTLSCQVSSNQGCPEFIANCGNSLVNDYSCDTTPLFSINNASQTYFAAGCSVDLFALTGLVSASSQSPDGFTGCTVWRREEDANGRSITAVIDYSQAPAQAQLIYRDTDGSLLLDLTYIDNTSSVPFDPGFDTFNFGNQPAVSGGSLAGCVTGTFGPNIQINP